MLKFYQFAIHVCADHQPECGGRGALRNGDEDVAMMREEYADGARYVLVAVQRDGHFSLLKIISGHFMRSLVKRKNK